MIPNQPPSPFLNEDHEAWRDTVRRFTEREIEPHVEEWEAAGQKAQEVILEFIETL